MRIAVTRPAEDAGPLSATLAAMGHDVTMIPLLDIVAREGVVIPRRNWQTVIATSANGIRCLPPGHGLQTFRMLTVGPQSLRAASAAGFARAEAHGGDVVGLADHITGNLSPRDGPLLYLSGAATSGDLAARLSAAGFSCDRLVLYDAVPAPALGPVEEELRRGGVDGVMLYSPRTARIWRDHVERAGLVEPVARLMHFCLSRNVAAMLPPAWRSVVAESPDEAAMLALLEQASRTL